ncbi:MAG: SGNH/GDSL hydrolase family protein [Labilithrix sp.]|nr:SGNH/GDSL hydrolase family protein [Labilithrix sp.]
MNSKAPSVLSFVSLLAIVACSKAAPPAGGQAEADAAAPATKAATSAVAPTAPAEAPSAETPAPAPKKYARVLHTGDSMVGGGLARALGPKFEADGTKYHRDVIESGTIHEFSQNDHLPKLIASIKPDLILLTLGANHVPHSIDPEKEIGPYLPKLLKRVAGIDCYWVAPPIWKPSQAKFNQWLREHVAPCRFYDASALDIARRPDKIHPNEKGGEVWADDFWKYFKGPGAFVEGAAGGALLAPDAAAP